MSIFLILLILLIQTHLPALAKRGNAIIQIKENTKIKVEKILLKKGNLMNREELKNQIKASIPCVDFLEKSKGGLYCCPFCNSGHNKNGTGALQYYPDTNTFYCHKCEKAGDVIDLMEEREGTDYNGALKKGAEMLRVEADGFSFNGSQRVKENNKKVEKMKVEENKVIDYKEYYEKLYGNYEEEFFNYIEQRGISINTASYFKLLYDPSWRSPKALREHKNPPASKRIIVPTSNNSYLARAIEEVEPAYKCINEVGNGKQHLFNEKALKQDNEFIFVCEGFFDAMSLYELNNDISVIGLNSTTNIKLLLKYLKEKKTEATFLICLDNDEAGKTATRRLTEGLQELNINYSLMDLNGDYNDINERLIKDRKGLEKDLRRAGTTKPFNTSDYIEQLMEADIELVKKAGEIKTGFPLLDEKLGGLYPGLYTIGAISSLGKTTFLLQIADNLAEQGKEVLFFSLEQSRLELVSKSIARRTFVNNKKNDDEYAVSSIEIRKGKKGANITKAINEYKEKIGDRISVIEGNFNYNISSICDYVKEYIQKNKTQPIVIIDYLQIIEAENTKLSTKENIDHIVTSLKRLSRQQNITIIVVSSMNRTNYLTQVDFESFKESGGIEYTSDVVIGLQLACISKEDIFNEEKKKGEKRELIRMAKESNPREIELVILKNRYGRSSDSCMFDYFPKFDTFVCENEWKVLEDESLIKYLLGNKYKE